MAKKNNANEIPVKETWKFRLCRLTYSGKYPKACAYRREIPTKTPEGYRNLIICGSTRILDDDEECELAGIYLTAIIDHSKPNKQKVEAIKKG